MLGRGLRIAAMLPLALWCIAGPATAQDIPAPKPPANKRLKAKVNQLIETISDPEVEVNITFRRSKLVRTKLDVTRVAVSDPGIVEVVAFGVREFELIGKETGSTTITIWLGGDDDAGNEPKLLSMLVTVDADTSTEDQRRLEFGELQDMINEMFPDSKVQLIPIADKLIVRGEARDAQDATRIMSLIRKEQGGGGGGATSNFVSGGTAAQPFPLGSRLYDNTVINLLEVPGEMQVMLKVRIAELKRSAIRRFGGQLNLQIDDLFLSSLLGGGATLFASQTFDNVSFQALLTALQSNGTAKILAEPNLVTLSGHPATFLSGGEFAVPTVTGVGGVQGIQTYFKGFGTSVSFTPTVLDKDRIRLQVNPSFTTLNKNNSVGGVFGLDSRSTSTTVDLREGQVLAIAGLIQEEQRGEDARIPLLGDIPYLGTFFGNRSISRDETELIVVVTPELVRPMEPEEAPQLLPGMEITEPDDFEFYFRGHIEGRPNTHHRSTVWPLYRDRLRGAAKWARFQSSEAYYIQGPYGFTD